MSTKQHCIILVLAEPFFLLSLKHLQQPLKHVANGVTPSSQLGSIKLGMDVGLVLVIKLFVRLSVKTLFFLCPFSCA